MAGERRPARRRIIAGLVGALAAVVCASLGFRAWREADPLARGLADYDRGNWQAAHAMARRSLESARSDPAALRLLARSSARLGRDESAEAIYRRLGAGRMEAEDLFLLGRGLLRSGRPGPAMASLRAARDADPNHAETLDALAARYAELGSTEEAAETAERLSRQPGWEVRGRVRLAPLLHELHNPSGAADVMARALAADPELRGSEISPAEASKLLARCLLQCGRPDDADQALRAVGNPARDPDAAWLLSRILLQQGKSAEARSALLMKPDEMAEADPMRPEPSPLLGAGRCAGCHDKQFESQQTSRHAATFVNPADLKAIEWPDRAVTDPANPEVRHTFQHSARGVEVITSVAGREFRALIEYALGSNHQGQSFLAREDDGRMRELRISRYPAPPIWDRTNQHPERPPDAAGYLGRPVASTAACLNCHVTSSAAVQNPAGRPEAADRGIGCERCHGPGGNHLLAIAAKFPEPAIARPRLAGAEQVMNLCGDCHKAPPGTSTDDPASIRFQAPSLRMSRCYTESDGGMSCITCHDPHRDADKSAAHYEVVCLNCHGPAEGSAAKVSRRDPRCPVNPGANCLECHMPRVSDAVPRATFTDHFIRVRRESSQTARFQQHSDHR